MIDIIEYLKDKFIIYQMSIGVKYDDIIENDDFIIPELFMGFCRDKFKKIEDYIRDKYKVP